MERDVSNEEPIAVDDPPIESNTEAATSPELSSEVKAAAEEDRATEEHDTTKNSSSATTESPDKPQETVQGSSNPKAADSNVPGETSKPDPAAPHRPTTIKKLSSTVLTKFQPEDSSDARSPMFDETKQKAKIEVRDTIFGARKVFNRKPPPPDQVKDTAPPPPDTTPKSPDTKVTPTDIKEDDRIKHVKVDLADKVDDDQKKGNDSDTDKKLNLVAEKSDDTIKETVPDQTEESSEKKVNIAAEESDDTLKETVSDTDQNPNDKKLNIAANEKDQVKEIVPGKSDKKLNLAAAKGSDQAKEIVPETHQNKPSDKKLNVVAKGNDQVKEIVPKLGDKKMNLAAAKGSDQVKETVPSVTPKLTDKKLHLAAKGSDHKLSEKKLNSLAKRNDQVKDAAFDAHKKAVGSPVKGNDTMKDIRAPETYLDGAESVSSGGSSPRETSFFHYPCKSKKSQEIHQGSRKFQHEFRRHDDDNCSVASSTATSARTNKFKPTVGVAPTFRCVERLEKRKEYYSKLENKHQALEAEKMEYEARRKEEEKEYVRQLRQTMVFKANPVPSFYKEGPPPKTELKKPPVTRPKSPKLTRRKSCGDVGNPEEKGASPRRTSTSCAKSPKKVKQNAKTTSTHHKVAEQQTADISVNG